MDLLNDDLMEYVNQYRLDNEAILSKLLDELMNRVQPIARMRFRRLTTEALMNRALNIWEESQEPFTYYFSLRAWFVTWLTNNGVSWTFTEMQNNVENICIFILRWMQETSRIE